MHGKTASHWQLHPARQRRLGTGIALLLGLVFIGSSLLLWPIDDCSPARSRAVMAKGQRPVPPPLRSRLGPDERRLRQVIQAEAFDAAHSARVEAGFVSYLDPGDWLCLRQIDFGSGATHFNARITAHPGFAGNNVEVRLGSATGRVVARLKTEPTGGWFTFTEQMAEMTERPQGVHDVSPPFPVASACAISIGFSSSAGHSRCSSTIAGRVDLRDAFACAGAPLTIGA